MNVQLAAALIALAGVALGSAITFLNSYLSWRRDRNKFMQDRLWEARQETYSAIITSIARLERLSSEILFGYTDEGGGIEGFHQGSRHNGLEQKLSRQNDEYVKLINASQLVMTKAMDERVFQLMSDLEAHARAQLPPDEWAEERYRICSIAERDVLILGKADLGIADR